MGNTVRQFKRGIALEPLASAPSSPIKGQLYYSDTSSSLWQFDGSVWKEVGSAGGGISAWVSAHSYNIADVIYNTADNKIYRATTANSDITFTPANWQSLSVEDLSGYVPYTGATTNVNLGTHSVTSNSVVVGGSANNVSGLSTITNTGTLTLPTSTDTLVGRATADILTNKDINGGTASDTSRFTIPQDTRVNLNALTRKKGTTAYANDSNKLLIDNGTILQDLGQMPNMVVFNDDMEDSYIRGLYTGTTGLTVTANTSTPLNGTTSLTITKDAVNRQNGYVSRAFTIGAGYQASMLTLSFTGSTGTNYLDNDMAPVIYDVTNSVEIPIIPEGILAGTNGQYTGQFQTSANSVSYQLRFKVKSTNALSYPITIDDIIISKQPMSYGYLRDKQYTLTVTNSNSTNWTLRKATGIPYKTQDGVWRLRFNIVGSYSPQPTLTGTTLTITGVTFASTVEPQACACMIDTGTSPTERSAQVVPNNGNIILQHTSTNVYGYGASGDVELASMPTISGFSDTNLVQLSSDVGSGVIGFSGYKTSTTTGLSGLNTIIHASVVQDTNNAYNTSTGTYTIPVSGWYTISTVSHAYKSTAGFDTLYLYVNGSVSKQFQSGSGPGASTDNGCIVVVSDYYTAGQTLQIKYNSQSTYNLEGGAAYTWLTILRGSGGSQQIAADATVAARYSCSSAQSVSTATIVNFDTLDYSTHNAVTTGASWKFTAPVSGIYSVKCSIWAGNYVWAINQDLFATLYKNGSSFCQMGAFVAQTTTSLYATFTGVSELKLSSGDYIDIRVSANRGATNLDPSTAENWVTVTRIK